MPNSSITFTQSNEAFGSICFESKQKSNLLKSEHKTCQSSFPMHTALHHIFPCTKQRERLLSVFFLNLYSLIILYRNYIRYYSLFWQTFEAIKRRVLFFGSKLWQKKLLTRMWFTKSFYFIFFLTLALNFISIL